jgi:hypothetical protein
MLLNANGNLQILANIVMDALSGASCDLRRSVRPPEPSQAVADYLSGNPRHGRARMSVQLFPVAFASVFVAGCLAIRALQRWSEAVAEGLGWIFAVVVAMLIAEVMANHMPRQYAAAPVKPGPSTRASYDTASFNQNGPTQMRAAPPYKVPTAFND